MRHGQVKPRKPGRERILEVRHGRNFIRAGDTVRWFDQVDGTRRSWTTGTFQFAFIDGDGTLTYSLVTEGHKPVAISKDGKCMAGSRISARGVRCLKPERVKRTSKS